MEVESGTQGRKGSLFWAPVASATAIPSPISTALTAPIDIMAFARQASSLSKTGSPAPAGIPETRHSTDPPEEFFSLMHCSSQSEAFSAASASGMNSLFFMIWDSSKEEIFTGPMDLVYVVR